MKAWLRAIRIHQWAKNGLIVVPALAAHRAPTADVVLGLVTALASFSLLASAVYLLNDLADLEHDRRHPLKRRRPLAAGEIDAGAALAAITILATASLAIALTLPLAFLATWATYLVLTTAYSFVLKRVVVLDVVVLAALYTARVVAGATAVTVPLSRWFLAFSVFVFLSLAMLKRLVETRGVADRDEQAVAGRGWRVGDLPLLMGFGAGSAVAGALVYCLYITGDEVLRLYEHPDLLWGGLPVLLYWFARLWLLADRGEVHEDPLVFALQDPASWASAALLAAVIVGAA